jgi:hypothetical protein
VARYEGFRSPFELGRTDLARRKFIVERDLPKVGALERKQLQEAAQKSNGALRQLGADIPWLESCVADDKTFCIYLATDEAIIRKYAEISGFPPTKINEIRKMMDPTTETVKTDQMRRRDFITLLGGAAAWPLAARAQQPASIPRLGVLLFSTPAADPQMETARRALRDLGYVEGRRPERLPDLAADLVRIQ